MTIRDLGYRPYEGERLPSSHNVWVLFRHGMRLAWASWLVKLAVIGSFLPALISAAVFGVFTLFSGSPDGGALEPAGLVRSLLQWQMWLFATTVCLGSGAGMIAEDLTHRAFQFYFAKPVTPPQYLLGRIGAVGLWCFLVLFLPTVLLVVVVVGAAPEELRLERAGLLLPSLISAVTVASIMSVMAVAVSGLSKSRALTMSAWLLLLLVPHVLALVVEAVAHTPWLRLLSIPALLTSIMDALFKVETDDAVRWYYAMAVLLPAAALAAWAAARRVTRAEVVL